MAGLIHTDKFKSKLFVRLFCSYVAIILSIFILFFCVIFFKTSDINRDRKNQYYNLKLQELGTALDVQFEEANVILASIKSSESFRNFNENWTSTYSPAGATDVINQIRNDIFSTNNLNIYDAVLWMEDSSNLYTSTQVYPVGKVIKSNETSTNRVQLTSINQMYGLNNVQTLLQKNWLTYSKECSNVFSKGTVSILFDPNSIVQNMKTILSSNENISFSVADTELCRDGEVKQAVTFTTASAVDSNVIYTLNVDRSNFKNSLSTYMILAIVAAIIAVIVFILLAMILANKYYQPVENIEKIIDEMVPDSGETDEFKNITLGIRKLIGERNGYREKMITIKPYAQQGVLHGIMNGNLEAEHVDVLFEEDYMVLHKPYFMLSVLNIAYIGKKTSDKSQMKRNKWIVQEVVNGMSNDDVNIVLYDKNQTDTFAIVNSNSNEGLEDIYYEMYKQITAAIDQENYAVTIGVDQVRDDISQINESCNNAIKTLGSMAIGGRGAVYFYEKEVAEDRHKYYFPKDAINKVTNAVKEGNIEFIQSFFKEILQINLTKYDISPSTVQLLIDEVHITTVKAIKNVNQLNTIDFNIEKIQTEATLEEVFEYYLAIYRTLCAKLAELGDHRQETDELNQKIIDCIDEKCFECDLSLQYLTEKFGVSNKYISIMCKKCLGMTYLQYVQEKRIRKAVSLMDTTTDTLEHISKQVGYSSLLTFRRNFKTIMGVNPSEYEGNRDIKE